MAGPGGRTVGRVNVRVLPDTSGFATALRTDLGKIEHQVKVNIPTELDTAGLSEKARAAADVAQRAAGTVNIKTELDRSSLSRSINGLGALATAGIALGPAILPVLAVIVAGISAMLGPLAAVTAGVGAFAAIAIPAFGHIADAQKAIATAQKAVESATTTKARAAAIQQLAVANAALTGPQRTVLAQWTQFKNAFSALSTALQPAVFAVVGQFLSLASQLLPLIAPLVKAAAAGFQQLLSKAQTYVPFWQQFFTAIAGFTAKGIVGFGTAVGGLLGGIANLALALMPLGERILPAIASGMQSFATWAGNLGKSKGFQNFIGYVVATAPKVGQFLTAFWQALKQIAQALVPIGGVVLAGLTGFLKVVAKVPVSVLTGLAAAIVPLVIGLKAWAIWQKIVNSQLIVAIAAATGLDAVPIVALIIGIVAAVALLVVGIVELIKHWSTVWGAIKAGFSDLLGFLKRWGALILLPLAPFIAVPLLILQHWRSIEAGLSSVWDGIKTAALTVWGFIRDHLQIIIESIVVIMTGGLALLPALIYQFWSQIQAGVQTAWDTIVGFFQALPGRIVTAISALPGLLLTAMTAAANALVQAIEYGIAAVIELFVVLPIRIVIALVDLAPTLAGIAVDAWNAFLSACSTAIDAIITFFTGLPAATATALTDLGSTLAGVATAAWGAFSSAAGTVIAAFVTFVTGLPGKILTALKDLGSLLSGLAASAWGAFTSATSTVVAAMIAFVTGIPGAIIGALTSLASLLAQTATSAWGAFSTATVNGANAVVSWIAGLPGKITGFFADAGTWLLGAGKAIMQGLLDGISSMFGAIEQKVSTLNGLLPSWKGPPARDKMLLYDAGQLVIGSLINGMESRFGDARATLSNFTDSIGAQPLDVAASDGSGLLAELRENTAVLRDVQRTLARMPKDYQVAARTARPA